MEVWVNSTHGFLINILFYEILCRWNIALFALELPRCLVIACW